MTAPTLGPLGGLRLRGIARAFPQRKLSNLEVLKAIAPYATRRRARAASEEEMSFVAQEMSKSVGVQTRYWAHPVGEPLDHENETSSQDLAIAAARDALEKSGLSPEEVGLVIVTTSTPTRMTSTLSAAVGHSLGIEAPCMDVRTGCSAGLFALTTAALYLNAGTNAVLLVAVETFSKVIPPQSRLAAASLGDGAVASVWQSGPGELEAAYLETDGALGKLITTEGRLPPTQAELEGGGYLLSGAPEELTEVVPTKYAKAAHAVFEKLGITGAEIDGFIPHQTSLPLINKLCEILHIPIEKTVISVSEHANIGSAGWLSALAKGVSESRFRPGDRLLLTAVGGGMSWGAASWRYAN